MKMPEYVTKAEVKRVCKELKLRDWSAIKAGKVTTKEASVILNIINVKKMHIPVYEFKQGL
jgi:hypothetical protein